MVNTLRWTYDLAGRLTSEEDANSQYQYQYGRSDRLANQSKAGSSGMPAFLFAYTYNDANREWTRSDSIASVASGQILTRYDQLDRVTRITQSDPSGSSATPVSPKRIDFTYDAVGNLRQLDRYAGLAGTSDQLVASSIYSYDGMHRLTSLVHDLAASPTISYMYQYDGASRITDLNSSTDGLNHLQYDDVGQLVIASGTGESYAYDGNGNRTGGAYQTGANNQLQSDDTYTYEYDAEGNRRFRRETGSSAYVEYVWDHHNRLSAVKFFDNAGALAKRVNYTYDVNDMRIGKQVLAGQTLVLQQRYVYENGEVAYVLDGNQRVTHRYLHGSAVDQVIADESYDASGASTGVSWALADHHGTVRDLVDSSGALTKHITYDAFGKMSTAQAADQLFAYTGREWDGDAQLYYYRARWYDAGVGRFISADSIGFEGGDANLFRYAGNSPLNFSDPTGLRVQTPQETMAAATALATWDRQTYDTWRRQAEIDQYIANLDPVERWYVERLGGLPVTPHATWAQVQENRRRSAQIERYTRESLAAAAERERLLAAQEFAASFVPLVGEVLDARVLFGPDSSLGERGLAGLSLAANLLTAGVLPNFGGWARATSRLSRVDDLLADTSRWADEAFFAPKGTFGGTGTYSGRPFDPLNAGGSIRNLTTERIKVTSRGIDVVDQHLSRFDDYAPTQQMLDRLRRIERGELTPTQTDLNFYSHELRELVRYRRQGWRTGVPDDLDARHTLWENSHTATLEDYRLREGPGSLYVPE